MNQFKDQIERIMTGKTCIPAVIVPLITALIFGYIFSNNQILESSVAVLDLDNSNYSRQLIGKLDASPYIEVNRVLNVPLEPEQLLINEQYLAVITLPQNLEANMYSGKQSNIGFILDYTVFAGSANLKQAIAEIFVSENITISISKLKNMGYSGEQALGLLNALSLQQRSLFNPTMDYVSSNVFGFVNLVILALLTIQTLQIIPTLRSEGKLLTAMESPLGLISRVLPYAFLYLISSIFVLGLLKQFAGLRFAGSVLEFLIPLFIYTFASAMLGMLLGWSAKEPAKAGQRVIIVVLPSFLFSNIILPVAPANWIRSSVVSPMADTTTTTCCPFIFISRTRQAIFLIFSIEATELPPNFATTNDKLLTPWIISHLLLNNNALPAYPA
jgi:ABC-2 type transport system permease protein